MQSLTQVKFIKRWKNFAESGSRAAGTALSHCRNFGRDSALPPNPNPNLPPLGLAPGAAAEGVAAGNTCGGGGGAKHVQMQTGQ